MVRILKPAFVLSEKKTICKLVFTLTVEFDLLHDGRVVPLAEDDDGESGVDVTFEFGDFFRKVFFFGVHNHQRAVLARVETGVWATQHFNVITCLEK